LSEILCYIVRYFVGLTRNILRGKYYDWKEAQSQSFGFCVPFSLEEK
jgi:hypothetical protein